MGEQINSSGPSQCLDRHEGSVQFHSRALPVLGIGTRPLAHCPYLSRTPSEPLFDFFLYARKPR